MKDIIQSLLKRNGIIVAIYAIATIAALVMPQNSMAIALYATVFLMIGLIWANGMLVKHMSRLLAALLTAANAEMEL